jgi:hypothetical protein
MELYIRDLMAFWTPDEKQILAVMAKLKKSAKKQDQPFKYILPDSEIWKHRLAGFQNVFLFIIEQLAPNDLESYKAMQIPYYQIRLSVQSVGDPKLFEQFKKWIWTQPGMKEFGRALDKIRKGTPEYKEYNRQYQQSDEVKAKRQTPEYKEDQRQKRRARYLAQKEINGTGIRSEQAFELFTQKEKPIWMAIN